MPQVSDYVMHTKKRLGNAHMSDRELGERFGLAASTISTARYGNMSDLLAIKVAAVLELEAGEVIMVARAERERHPAVKKALLTHAKNVLQATATEAWRKRSVSLRRSISARALAA